MSSPIDQLIQRGVELHRSGRLREAESCYQSARQQQPQHPDPWHLLGVIASQVGRHDLAVELIERAIALKPDSPEFYVSCAEAHRARGNYRQAIAHLQEALSRRPAFAGAHVNLGNVYREMGELDAAEAQYRTALDIQSNVAVAHNNLGLILKDTGRGEEAIACFEKAIGFMPGYFEAFNNLGNTLLGLGRAEEAIKYYEQALAVVPDYAEAHSNMGTALRELGRLEEALEHYRRAVQLRPDSAMAHYNLGIALDETGRPEEAVSEYERALAIHPDYAEAHNNLGNALDQLGRQEAAVAHYRRAVAARPEYAEAHRNLARLKPEPQQVGALERLLATPSLPETDAVRCHFALGDIHHGAGQYHRAFEHYRTGNMLQRRALRYDAQQFSARVDRLIEVFSGEFLQEATAGGSDSEVPVFILGMPRSGTSLVEQIISSHPAVQGGGELPFLVEAENAIAIRFRASAPYPDCLRLLGLADKRQYAGSYLASLEGLAGGAGRITDKLPGNFQRVGLIRMLFPAARVIHCQRNPMDTCVSNYFNYFSFGNEFACDLDELGQYYLDQERLMTHWKTVFPGAILTVRYEDLVANQEQASRGMIEYLGLVWDDRCLDFHKTERVVNKFSSGQVRQPLYTRSVERWKHYGQQLAPLAAVLHSG